MGWYLAMEQHCNILYRGGGGNKIIRSWDKTILYVRKVKLHMISLSPIENLINYLKLFVWLRTR